MAGGNRRKGNVAMIVADVKLIKLIVERWLGFGSEEQHGWRRRTKFGVKWKIGWVGMKIGRRGGITGNWR